MGKKLTKMEAIRLSADGLFYDLRSGYLKGKDATEANNTLGKITGNIKAELEVRKATGRDIDSDFDYIFERCIDANDPKVQPRKRNISQG